MRTPTPFREQFDAQHPKAVADLDEPRVGRVHDQDHWAGGLADDLVDHPERAALAVNTNSDL